jgi:4-amino-4-deoxy-L-arabinose transferase-like glycosyltransferase
MAPGAAGLRPATRRQVQIRSLGLVALVAGLVLCWWSYDSLQRGHYELKYLFAVPPLIIGGLLGVLLPSAMAKGGRTPQKVVVVVSLLATLGLGFLFSRWFVATFAPR